MVTKKGISPAIAWILILGLSITLAAFVFNWYSDKAETISTSVLDDIAGGVYCDDVEFNILKPNTTATYWRMQNSGTRTITKIKLSIIRSDMSGLNTDIDGPFPPGDEVNLFSMGEDVISLQIFPYIEVEETEYYCPNEVTYDLT
ncbi:MAG: hypothetical protein ABIF40_00775 [archaeon]